MTGAPTSERICAIGFTALREGFTGRLGRFPFGVAAPASAGNTIIIRRIKKFLDPEEDKPMCIDANGEPECPLLKPGRSSRISPIVHSERIGRNHPMLEILQMEIMQCEQCPRLRQHCKSIATLKRRAYRDWEYWGR